MIKVFESVGDPADLLDDQVDRFSAAIADAVGVEVGQHLGSPGAEGTAQPGDLRNGAGVEAIQDLIAICRPLAGYCMVDGAQLLVALPARVQLIAGVAGVETCADLGSLAPGEVLCAMAAQPADLIERVVFVAAAASVPCCTRRRTTSTTSVPSRTTWNASSTATASGRPS
jgi:hypothetical protein